MVRNIQYNQMPPLGRNLSGHTSSSRKQTRNKCSTSGDLDNFVLIDIDNDLPDVIIIDVPESVQNKLRKPSPRTVISIDDDEVAGGVCSNENDSASSEPTSTSAKANGSRNHYGLGSESDSGSTESDCSDCECMDGPVEKLREQWEIASNRRKATNAFQDIETKVTNEPCSYNRQPIFNERFDCHEPETLNEDPVVLKSQLSGDANCQCDSDASMDVDEELPNPGGVCNTGSNGATNANVEAHSGGGLASFQHFKSYNKVDMAERNTLCCREPGIISLINHKKAETDSRYCHSVQTEADGSTSELLNGLTFNKTNDVLEDPGGKPCQNDTIIDRQKIKETDEYKRAMEEEWASRQRQLQIQAEEAQRLRRRKRAESSRIMDMERRQKQRLEEMRETQRKDEENLNMREQLRVEIRKELNQIERSCRDMASLLRKLGLHVSGGLFPSENEVQAAYKKALLKFHPDRASRTDVRQQVEAEEKFKLISRMKEQFCLAG